MTILYPAYDDTSNTRFITAVDQNLSQQRSTSNDKGYQNFTSVTCIDSDNFPGAHYFAHQPLSCNTGSYGRMCLEMSEQIYDNTGAFDTVEMLATGISREYTLPFTHHQQTYLDRTTCSSLESCDLISTAGSSSVSTTTVSPLPITANDIAPSVSFGSTPSPREEAAKRRTDTRRAQNRAAQRAFRARWKETMKESTAKLKKLKDNLACLQSANAGLSESVANLTAKVLRLQGENAILKQSRPCYGLRQCLD